MKKFLIFLTIFLLIGVAMWYALSKQDAAQQIVETPTETPIEVPVTPPVLFAFATSTLTDNAETYIIEASYPIVENQDVNNVVAKFVTDTIMTFKADVEDAADVIPEGRQYAMWMESEAYSTDHYQTFVFQVSVDMGGAHPNHFYSTFTFDAAGELVTIQDLIQREYGDQAVFFEISDVVQAKLRAELGEEAADAAWLPDGAGPESTNFQDFYVTEGTMHFLFEPYAIGPYSLSSREVEVRFDEIKSTDEGGVEEGE